MKKRILTLTASLCLTFASLCAQTEGRNDTDFDTSRHYKDFGGFLLDMSPVMMTPPPIRMSLIDFRLYDTELPAFQLNPEAIRLPMNVTYNRTSSFTSSSPHGFYGGPTSWQEASYRLKNGLSIHTYGEYDADGRKRYNPAALPWERNRFNAAFEVKSPNGKFGIKVEMNGGRNYP